MTEYINPITGEPSTIRPLSELYGDDRDQHESPIGSLASDKALIRRLTASREGFAKACFEAQEKLKEERARFRAELNERREIANGYMHENARLAKEIAELREAAASNRKAGPCD